MLIAALLAAGGLYISAKTGFIQLNVLFWIKNGIGRVKKSDGGVSPFAAAATALGGAAGTGNIAGAAAAVAVGGAGALFWMWVFALTGMALKYAEAWLAIKYKGGPMAYIRDGLGMPRAAKLFAFAACLAAPGVGALAQSGAFADTAAAFSIPPWVPGALGVAVSLLLFSGAGRIARMMERAVPVMALLYIAGCIAVIAVNARELPAVIKEIFSSAFAPRSAAGASWYIALKTGAIRGIFSNEAGMGSAAVIYSKSDCRDPNEQGSLAIFEVFADTLIMCTLTGLSVLCANTTGALSPVTDAFGAALGAAAKTSVLIFTAFFALMSILCWGLIGEECALYIKNSSALKIFYRLSIAALSFAGAYVGTQGALRYSDIMNSFMAVINITALLFLAKEIPRHKKV